MRIRWGRPDLDRYAGRFDVPAAEASSPVTVSWLGVSTVLIQDGGSIEGGGTALLTDGFFSRPGLLDVGLRRLSPSLRRIDGALNRAGVSALAAVLPVHTHYDHAMDTGVVALRTGARVVGGQSAANVARGQGVPESHIKVAEAGREIDLGSFGVTLIESEHCPPDRFPGTVTHPVRMPARVSAFRCGEAWSTLVHHRPSGRRLLIQGSAGFRDGALDGRQADVAYLGVGQLGPQPADYVERYWQQTVRTVGARRVVLIHWDDFFRPLSRPPRALPFVADDLDATMAVLAPLAERDGVALHFPQLWRRCDPWR